MNKQYKLSVKSPCQEQWSDFQPTTLGGFCQLCKREVVDFTSMSDEELVNFLRKNNENICGRLESHQVKRSLSSKTFNKPFFGNFMKAGMAALTLLLVVPNAQAQKKPVKDPVTVEEVRSTPTNQKDIPGDAITIKGTVKDDLGEPLPGVNVMLKGGTSGTVTDQTGKFTFPKQLRVGDVLVFSFIGLETQEYRIPATLENDPDLTMDALEINLSMTEYVLLGEVAVEEIYISENKGFKGLWGKVKSLF